MSWLCDRASCSSVVRRCKRAKFVQRIISVRKPIDVSHLPISATLPSDCPEYGYWSHRGSGMRSLRGLGSSSSLWRPSWLTSGERNLESETIEQWSFMLPAWCHSLALCTTDGKDHLTLGPDYCSWALPSPWRADTRTSGMRFQSSRRPWSTETPQIMDGDLL